jgi:hypothetical protein
MDRVEQGFLTIFLHVPPKAQLRVGHSSEVVIIINIFISSLCKSKIKTLRLILRFFCHQKVESFKAAD